VVAITGAEEVGVPSASKVRAMVEPILRNAEKAKRIKAKMGTVSTLEALAAAQGQTVQRADSIMFSNPTIPGAGQELKVAGVAFNKANLNKVVQPMEGSSGVYAIKTEMIGAKTSVAMSVDEQRKQMESQLKQSMVYATISGLRKAANITDNRSKIL